MDAHLARNMREDFVTVVETDLERGRGERFDDFAIKAHEFFIIGHSGLFPEKSLPTQKERRAVSSASLDHAV
jgi:hypothetical protein